MLNAEQFKSQLAEFTGTENYYRYIGGIQLTDGAKFFAEKLGAFWFLDIVASYQFEEPLINEQDFQVWKIKVSDRTESGMGRAVVTCDDGNGNILVEQKIDATDFPLDEGELWYQRKVIFAKSEY